jgi:hypothetical protein
MLTIDLERIQTRKPVRKDGFLDALCALLTREALTAAPMRVRDRVGFSDYLSDFAPDARDGITWNGDLGLMLALSNPGGCCTAFEHAFTHWFEQILACLAARPAPFCRAANLRPVAARSRSEIRRSTRPLVYPERDQIAFVADPARPFAEWQLVTNEGTVALATLSALDRRLIWERTRPRVVVRGKRYRADNRVFYELAQGKRKRAGAWLAPVGKEEQDDGGILPRQGPDFCRLPERDQADVLAQLERAQCNCGWCAAVRVKFD